ncbi:hypothetical protein K466DRAFT_587693 [Polyporus arcularius HHB13444]|uniref:Uncharacterized protein n=1 Tax=Polyporus arcularius HHB13444 TaxID=1314778 RepID=A0A5C3P8D7_9APHY|nr:hypothetical protein K466DRAFT_587693 [Polyporus arcularius HHB13444]
MTVLPFVYRGFRSCLPSGRVRALLSALSELDELYCCSLESGFMSDFAATALRDQVHALHARADALRFRAMKATTLRAELKDWSRGLSSEISEAIRDVKALRRKISAMGLDVLEAQQRQPVYFYCDVQVAVPPHYDMSAIVQEEAVDMVVESKEAAVAAA